MPDAYCISLLNQLHQVHALVTVPDRSFARFSLKSELGSNSFLPTFLLLQNMHMPFENE